VSFRIIHVMPTTKVTERRGRWLLVQAGAPNGDYIVVISNEAPEATRAFDLKPTTIEITPGPEWDDSDPITISIEDLNELMRWPR
jgi:hypothetical protein